MICKTTELFIVERCYATLIIQFFVLADNFMGFYSIITDKHNLNINYGRVKMVKMMLKILLPPRFLQIKTYPKNIYLRVL